MKLIAEKDREGVRRYGHVRKASWGSARCGERLKGSSRACTRTKSHRGPHVAHGSFGRVLAVWDAGAGKEVSRQKPPRPTKGPGTRGAGAAGGFDDGPVIGLLRTLGRRLVPTTVEEIFLLVLFVVFSAFVIDWALKILGLS